MPSSDGKDRWEYIWGTGYFSCSKAYKHLKGHGNSPCFQVAMEVSLSTETQNLLFWLLMQDKLSTIEILRRRITVLEDYGCAVCRTGLEETVEHLFLKCPFSIQCWASLNLNSPINLQHLQILEVFRTRLQVPFFMEIIISMCY